MNMAAAAMMAAALTQVFAQADSGRSPVVNADNSVTLRLTAPEADEVEVKGDFISRKVIVGPFSRGGSTEMKEGNDGEWTYTSAPLESELYTYRFEADGELLCDPSNPRRMRDVADTLSWFVVRGGIADDYVDRDVPHGRVADVWYSSSLPGMKRRRMKVYLPAGYDKDRRRRYPVLYLLHGSGGDEESWSECGRAVQILDNMMADGRCEPMIVAMPNGNVDLAAAPGKDPANPDVAPSGNNASSMLGKFEQTFMDDVVGYVDGNFRTESQKDRRAIAGLSMGGLHTIYITLNNPDSFGYVGLFSAQTTNAIEGRKMEGMKAVGDAWNSLKKNLPFIGGGKVDRTLSKYSTDALSVYEDADAKLERQFSTPPRLYYIALGEDDFVKKLNTDWRKRLDKGGYGYVYRETDGGHTWRNWRRYLVDFLPRLFRQDSGAEKSLDEGA